MPGSYVLVGYVHAFYYQFGPGLSPTEHSEHRREGHVINEVKSGVRPAMSVTTESTDSET